jgi:uncharacterized protein
MGSGKNQNFSRLSAILGKMKWDFILNLILMPLLFWGCLMEEKFIFYPSSRIDATPREVGLLFEDIFFSTSDGVRLNGWFVSHPSSKATLLWSHGNAGNIGHRVENIKLLHEKVGISIFIFDYRGYGRSEGSASEEGTYRDAEAALQYLRSRKDVDPRKIVFFGRSLGAAVAAELATREDGMALILETPFASIREMARTTFPLLPVGPFLRTRYDVVEKIKKIKVPLLVLHGDRDEVVPFSQGRKVFEEAPGPKEFYTIHGAHHNDTYITGGDPYFAALKNFIERAEAQLIRP